MDRKLRQINFKLDDVKEKKLQLQDENDKKEEIIKRADDRLQDVRSELKEYQNEAAQLENQLIAKDEQIRWLKGRVDAMTQEKNDIEVSVSDSAKFLFCSQKMKEMFWILNIIIIA